MYDINNDFLQIISGTSNRLSNRFLEAKANVETSKGALGYLKNFVTSIEALSNKTGVKDERISSSKGNIRAFVGFENIKTSMEFIKNNLRGVHIVKDLDSLYNSIQSYQPQYVEGYNKNISLIILEYESAMDLLVTGITLVMANNVGISHNGTRIKIIKKGSDDISHVTAKIIKEFAAQLSNKNHRDYLEGILKTSSAATTDNSEINESYLNPYTEATFIDTIGLIDRMVDDTGRIIRFGIGTARAIKNSLFGIVPLIRSALYIKYKKKADTINALDQQVSFIKMNIEQLENITTMDPVKKAEIIQRQKAVIEQYEKRAAKLRAELTDGEREASVAINNENPRMGTPNNTDNTGDDDFVLEVAQSFSEAGSRDFVMSKHRDGFFKLGGNNNKNDTEKSVPSIDIDIKALEEEIYEKYFAKFLRKTISLDISSHGDDKDMSKRTASKFGGIPYWPKDMEWPSYNGDPMLLVAQLNFSQLPHIDGFPTSGILQFFAINDEWYNSSSGEHVCVFHKDIINDPSRLMINVPRSTLEPQESWDIWSGVYYITGTKIEDQLPSNWDDVAYPNSYILNVENEVLNIVNSKSTIKYSAYKDLPEKLHVISSIIWNKSSRFGTRIGGYPDFTQSDPRNNNYNTLLLQIDSGDGIQWGDCGVANFFISPDKLRNADFSDVLFNWDCY